MRYRSTPGDPKKKKKGMSPQELRKLNKGGPYYAGGNDLELAEEIFDPETYELIDGKLYYRESGEEASHPHGPHSNTQQGRIAPYEKTIFDYFTALFGK